MSLTDPTDPSTKPRKGSDRNKPCWCGSGQKYKKCHGVLELAPTPSRTEVARIAQHLVSHRHAKCMHPQAGAACSSKIIKAHSVQRSGGLTRIALRGEVYYFRDTMRFMMNPAAALEPGLVGCKEASVFPGFCAYHDALTFKPIDDQEFAATPEQVFLLAYRALSREFIGVQTRIDTFSETFKLLRGQQGQRLEEKIYNVTQQQLLIELNLRQLKPEKDLYDTLLLAARFDRLDHYIIWLDRIPDMLCSMYVQPWSDFVGNVLQPLPNPDGHWQSCAFSIVALDGAGAAVFSWDHDQSPAVLSFIRSLHHVVDPRLPDSLIRFAFEYSDNVCLAPTWWQRLP